ncbi:hypothetical protein PHYC_00243 [Phycisphaerales bacterium]|nr:hypothetical protein PHYC_00243 [Phycisphaerales bacterium]
MSRPSLAALLAASLSSSVAFAQTSSTFDLGDEGWMVIAFPYSHTASPGMQPVVWDANIGLPPGSLYTWDQYGETGVAAPAKFLGDQSGSYGRTLTFDILIMYSDAATYPAVVLNAGTFSLFYNMPSSPVGVWEHRVVPLAAAGWRYNSWTGPEATEAQMQAALAGLAGLYINTEWRTGPDETHVDNVVLGGAACDPDVNCDGAINGFDIEATEQAVNGDFSNFCQPTADLNNDGAENGFDIETEEQRVNGAPCE